MDLLTRELIPQIIKFISNSKDLLEIHCSYSDNFCIKQMDTR